MLARPRRTAAAAHRQLEPGRLRRGRQPHPERARRDRHHPAAARGWITQDAGGAPRADPGGLEFHGRAEALHEELWDERREGVSDEEYLITLKVLQRFVHHTGGRAWRH
ncbi:hypothetical protein [Streptomyces virginiae]|uniref:hypothetical protein n=1 Tax=Streptomyces virginiae TaxID=1961 RepID=UPI0036F8C431